ncbi:hypothetical protein H0A36_23385 [Endozoicomonas sp. SM1973]|uniref:Uncharacterized protein n=1 Tax=Spartinivicinus marinus TaxID=2994442 RepID=A0A853IHR3_9GAMM|nr:hypothetical protein [Spartinivicinus marinus]MCX4025079.1 hypothetical protein [Spartinivicinus marinus]NYZ68967.1 hypothetical protein [Spartinivicinus marinus]
MQCRVMADLDRYYQKQEQLENAFLIKEIDIKQTAKDLLNDTPVRFFNQTWTFDDVYDHAAGTSKFTDITKSMACHANNPEDLNKTLNQYRQLLIESAFELACIIHGED